MATRRRSKGSDATTLQTSPETKSSEAAKVTPEGSTAGESVKTAATLSPTEGEIAAVAYQLWLNNGCPVGSDQENWLRAERMLRNAFVAISEDLSKRSSIRRCDTRSESAVLCEFRWDGHLEVWEMEWSTPRWVLD